jgi:hypothetical protein
MVAPYKLDYSLVAREVRRLAAAFGPSDKRSSAKSCMNAQDFVQEYTTISYCWYRFYWLSNTN